MLRADGVSSLTNRNNISDGVGESSGHFPVAAGIEVDGADHVMIADNHIEQVPNFAFHINPTTRGARV